MFRTALLLFFLLYTHTCPAQFRDEFNFHFRQYSVADGLPDNAVIKSVKDQNGFLWIATLNGISRFDGSSFKNYLPQTAASGLRSGWISDIIIDGQQQLWASTEGGLCYYHEASDRFVYINPPGELQIIFKMPLAQGDAGTIWLATEGGLFGVNTTSKKYLSTSLRRIVDPQFVIVVPGNRLLVGTRGHGLLEYNIAADNYTSISLPFLPQDAHFMGAMADAGGTWVACSEGMLLQDKDGWHLYNRFPGGTSPVKALMCVTRFDKAFGHRYILCGSYDKKLTLFDTHTKSFCYQWKAGYSNPAGFTAAVLNHLYSDGDLLWISGNRGLQLLNLEAQQQHAYFIEGLHDPGQSVSVKKAILHYNGSRQEVWMIPFQSTGGVIRYDLAARKLLQHFNKVGKSGGVHYFDIINSTVNNEVIAAGEDIIDVYSSSKGFLYSVKTNTGSIQCIKEDKKGNWWIGTKEGLAFIERATKKVTVFRHRFKGTELEDNSFGGPFPVYDIAVANDSILYLSNLKYGLFDFNIRTHRFNAHRIATNASFSTDNRSVALALTGNDTLYTGTYNGLMGFSMLQQRFVSNFTKSLPGPVYIYSLLPDSNGRIWARTNQGILGYEPATGASFSFNIKGEADISYYQQRLSAFNRHQLIMGHEGGFSILNTDAITNRHLPAPLLYMNNVLLNNSNLSFKRDSASVWKFNYRQNQLSFQVAVIEFNDPGGIRYHYKLEGLDKEWKDGGTKNIFNYNFLPHGKYRFCIYARNTINGTQSPVLYFSFVIQPAWWQHWWLWPLVAVLFALLVLYIARKRIIAIRRREAQQTLQNKTMAELELKMLRSQMNPHFIFNSLNSIQKYIWENKEEDAADYLSSFAKLMRAILEHSRKELVSLKEETDVMKLYIELEHRRSNGSFEYNIHIDEALGQHATLIPPMIMQPFIENAIWHGLNKKGSKGHLSVSVKKNSGQLVCIIEDDGNGFDMDNPVVKEGQASLGIEITKQRLEKLMHGTGYRSEVSIRSRPAGAAEKHPGTIVTIYLPLQTI